MRARFVGFGLAFVAGASVSFAQTGEHEGPDFQARRDAYLHMMQDMPAGALDRALQLKASMLRTPSFATLPNNGSWVAIGPGGFFLSDSYFSSLPQTDAGRVDAVTFDPSNSNTMYIATPGGGVWQTTNAGASWKPLTDNQCSLQSGAVAVDPVNTSLVYAGIANAYNTNACGLIRSTDGGSNWITGASITGSSFWRGGVNRLYIDPATAGSPTSTTMVLSGSGGVGILRSTSSGSQWTKVNTFTIAYDVVSLPATPTTLYTGVINTSNSSLTGLYKSTDDGQTWTQISAQSVNFGTAGRFALATSPAAPNSVFILGGSQFSKFMGLWRWDENTQQMTTLAAAGVYNGDPRGDFGSQATYDLPMAVDPSDANRIYIAGVRAFRSLDGGATFQPMAQNIHCDWHAITIDPKNHMRVAAGTDGGVFLSQDGGETWLSLNNGLSIGMYYPGISLHPTDANILIGGTQDNGTQVANGTVTWSGLSGGDGGYTAMNYQNPSIRWSTAQWSSSGAYIQRRNALTGTSTYPVSGIVASDRGTFIPPLVMDPVTPTTLYFGTHRLYRLSSETPPWVPISGDLTKGSGAILSIAIAPSNPKYIYVGTTDGNIQVSHDGGTTFIAGAGQPTGAVTHIAVDPQDSTHAIATFASSTTTYIYSTANGGVNWTALAAGGLPAVPTYAAVILPGQSSHFFAGDAIGVWESTDAGNTWVPVTGTGTNVLPNVWVYDLVYNSNTQQLVAATYGRGLFSYSLASATTVLRGDVDASGSVDAFDALLVQQAMVGLSIQSKTGTPLTAMPRGDANCNGKLESADALIILNYAVGITPSGSCVGTIK